MLNAAWQPAAASPALNIGTGPADSFFDTVNCAGAFDGNRANSWTEGWLETAQNWGGPRTSEHQNPRPSRALPAPSNQPGRARGGSCARCAAASTTLVHHWCTRASF